MSQLQNENHITILLNRKKIVINVNSILYILMFGNRAELHVLGGKIYDTRMSLHELSEKLGDRFIKVHRGCIVSVMAIHDITDVINLSNGESLIYTKRKKREIIEQFHEKRKKLIDNFASQVYPMTDEEYSRHYKCFDSMPFAFSDIEMIFNEEKHAVDWIFRYGNPALEKLENMQLEQMIGSSFNSLFSNMDSKWLRSYERATLYGETLEIVDYSPEIEKYLKVICFPTFKGHCGCILFDMTDVSTTQPNSCAEKALLLCLGKMSENTDERLQK